jgi:threonine dehydrogenase-like Zn-dependent dehydrogenase
VPRSYHPGHELVGVVEQAGSGVGIIPGTRVTVEPILACGACKWCRGGDYNLCRTMSFFGCTTPDGGMADRFVIPADRLIRLPGALGDLDAALVEPLSTPVHAVRLAGGDLTGRSVAILGAGTIGLLVLAVTKQANAARIAVCEPLPAKRDLALRWARTLCSTRVTLVWSTPSGPTSAKAPMSSSTASQSSRPWTRRSGWRSTVARSSWSACRAPR